MMLLNQTGGGALSGRTCPAASTTFTHPNNPQSIFSKHHRTRKFINPIRTLNLTVAKSDGGGVDSSSAKQSFTTTDSNQETTVFVGEKNVPLEGVIQFDKPSSPSKLDKWGRVALLSGGDVLSLLIFSAIGRFTHGFSVMDIETLRTADPFIAGWFLSAYFLGGYDKDGRGLNGLSKAVIAAAKSWAVGIPLGIIIRSTTSGHIPPSNFILVTMGSTAFLLIGWRALLNSILPSDKSKKNDVYRRGSPFELFELLASLIRRW